MIYEDLKRSYASFDRFRIWYVFHFFFVTWVGTTSQNNFNFSYIAWWLLNITSTLNVYRPSNFVWWGLLLNGGSSLEFLIFIENMFVITLVSTLPFIVIIIISTLNFCMFYCTAVNFILIEAIISRLVNNCVSERACMYYKLRLSMSKGFFELNECLVRFLSRIYAIINLISGLVFTALKHLV